VRSRRTRRSCGPQFGLDRIDWPDAEGPDFNLTHGEMLRLLRETGLAVEALSETTLPGAGT
jgi:hypothetical protein